MAVIVPEVVKFISVAIFPAVTELSAILEDVTALFASLAEVIEPSPIVAVIPVIPLPSPVKVPVNVPPLNAPAVIVPVVLMPMLLASFAMVIDESFISNEPDEVFRPIVELSYFTDRVPVVVIGPPVKPAPLSIVVIVPLPPEPPEELIVTMPEPVPSSAEIVTLFPATIFFTKLEEATSPLVIVPRAILSYVIVLFAILSFATASNASFEDVIDSSGTLSASNALKEYGPLANLNRGERDSPATNISRYLTIPSKTSDPNSSFWLPSKILKTPELSAVTE